MQLSKKNITYPVKIFPEKVLQFGTGILLRGLPDYFIHEANQKNIFNGSIVIVKSTDGDVNDFTDQDNLFTTFIKGIEKGEYIERTIINSSISRVLSAQNSWNEIINISESDDLQVIISNTTEIGLQYINEDIFASPPLSFPAKLTSLLFNRFNKKGNSANEIVIIPTELITNNGLILKETVHQHINFNHLPNEFILWLDKNVIFCNSLVDRIVTAANINDFNNVEYEDKLAIKTEPYNLWAIEGDEKVKNILIFSQTNKGLIINENIDYYRERKLRILNGTHTISVCLGFWMDFNTVYECMQNELVGDFIESVMFEEIVPTLNLGTQDENILFAKEVLDRFNNPDLKHLLLNITMQQTAKMKMRNLPTIIRYYEKFNKVPIRLVMGFMAYLLFMKATHIRGDKYYGMRRGNEYLIYDDQAEYFYNIWKDIDIKDETAIKRLVLSICRNSQIWEMDLSHLPDFVETVSRQLIYLTQKL